MASDRILDGASEAPFLPKIPYHSQHIKRGFETTLERGGRNTPLNYFVIDRLCILVPACPLNISTFSSCASVDLVEGTLHYMEREEKTLTFKETLVRTAAPDRSEAQPLFCTGVRSGTLARLNKGAGFGRETSGLLVRAQPPKKWATCFFPVQSGH